MEDSDYRTLKGQHRFSSTDLPGLFCLRDVPILTSKLAFRTLYDGGPQWPDWDQQCELRHSRSALPVEIRPQKIPRGLKRIDECFVWGGNVHRHFGHQVAEYATRVLQAATERPDDRLLFALWPRGTVETIPDFFWEITEWYGIGRDRIKIVEQPFVASELWVAVQGEQLGGPGPSQAYLYLQEKNATERGLQSIHNEILFVTRAKMMQRGLAATLGEGYLVDRLNELGVAVLVPEAVSLRRQIEYYAGARTLVFAQGSAMHGRQLLGRVEQDIVVLLRRARTRQGLQELLARCRSLTFAETAESNISRVLSTGENDNARAIAVYDIDVLFHTFLRLGVDLASVWDEDAFHTACKADLLIWIQAAFEKTRQYANDINWPSSAEKVRRDLDRLGFTGVLESAGYKLRALSRVERIAGRIRTGLRRRVSRAAFRFAKK